MELFKLSDGREVLVQGLGSFLGLPGVDAILVSNAEMTYGAGVIKEPEVQELLDRVFKNHGGYYVLPASVHEVICVPKEGMRVAELNQMISAINQDMQNFKDESEILGWEVLEVVDGELVPAKDCAA